jgi:hypothetical protein
MNITKPLSKTLLFNRYLSAILLSWIVFAFTLYNYPTITSDATLYLQTSRVFLAHGLHAAMQYYHWPFLAIVIAITHKLTGLSVLRAGLLLNALALPLTAILLMRLVRKLGGNSKLEWLALIVLLCDQTYTSNFHDIIRGPGYYIFYLSGLLLFLKFSEKLQWRYAVAWFISSVLMTLFRIDGAAFILLMPLCLLLFTQHSFLQKIYGLIKLIALGLLVIIAAALIKPDSFCHLLSKASFAGKLKLLGTLGNYQNIISTISNRILPPAFHYEAFHLIVFGFLGVYVCYVISNIGLPYLISLGACVSKRTPTLKANYRDTLFSYIAINLAMTVLDLFVKTQTTERYFIALSLTLFTLVPFGLQALYAIWKTREPRRFYWQHWLFPLVALLITAQAVNTIHHFGPSKQYRARALHWLQKHSTKQQIIFTNEAGLIDYLQNPVHGSLCQMPTIQDKFYPEYKKLPCFQWDDIQPSAWKGASFLFLKASKHNKAQIEKLNKILGRKPIKVFIEKRRHSKRILIYKLN